MTNTKNKLNALLKAFLPLLALLIICTVSASFPINAEELHTNDGNGTCTNCGEALILEYKKNDTTLFFTDFTKAIDHAMANGGTLKMLCDIDANNNGIHFDVPLSSKNSIAASSICSSD